MYKKFSFRGKKYIIDLDRALYVLIMTILIILLILGFIKVSNDEAELIFGLVK